jgi:hypothetical protein
MHFSVAELIFEQDALPVFRSKSLFVLPQFPTTPATFVPKSSFVLFVRLFNRVRCLSASMLKLWILSLHVLKLIPESAAY